MPKTLSRRQILKASSALALSAYSTRVLSAAPPAEAVTPELIAAAKKEGKVVHYTSVDLPLAEKVSARLKASGLAGGTVTLKLKSDEFKIRTRARGLADPTQLAEKIFAAGRELLARETDATRFRLIGIGVSDISEADKA